MNKEKARMTDTMLEQAAPAAGAATYMPQAQGQSEDRRAKKKAPVDAPSKMGVRDLDLYYKDFHALKGINLEFPQNQVTALIGPSGCGKSTLLKSLNRMNDLVEGCRIEGEITLDGADAYKSIDVNSLRRRVGMVFQQPNPFPMTVYDNIAFGPRTHGIKNRADLDEIVEQSLRDAAIWDELKDRLKKNALGLSGGQQQRLCIARALAVRPGVLLMDEATSALDPISTAKIEDLVGELKASTPSSWSRTTCCRRCACPTRRRSSCWERWWKPALPTTSSPARTIPAPPITSPGVSGRIAP